MGLEHVQQGVKQRLAEDCEPDQETCKRRDELREKRRVLSRIRCVCFASARFFSFEGYDARKDQRGDETVRKPKGYISKSDRHRFV
jgi:hypothetical protein